MRAEGGLGDSLVDVGLQLLGPLLEQVQQIAHDLVLALQVEYVTDQFPLPPLRVPSEVGDGVLEVGHAELSGARLLTGRCEVSRHVVCNRGKWKEGREGFEQVVFRTFTWSRRLWLKQETAIAQDEPPETDVRKIGQ